MLEIGTFEGRSAIWWSQNILVHPQSSLICVDPWAGNDERHRQCKRNLVLAGVKNIRVFRMKSQDIRTVPESMDLIMIDGDHNSHAVLQDLVICWKILRRGGVMILDDYGLEVQGMIGPKPAIDGFMASYEPFLKVLHIGYQVILKKL